MMVDSRLYNGQDPFIYRAPTQDQIDRITIIRTACQDLMQRLLTNVDECAERVIAIRKLEEVSMWANKAIVFERPR